MDESLRGDHFDAIYRGNSDPWNYRQSDYEARKYAATLAALPQRRFADAFEIGCSIGVLTEHLASRCERLLAVDASKVALELAGERCRGLDNVELRRMQVPDEFPDRCFDLIVLSEVGYYWSADDLRRAASRMIDALTAPGWLLLVHWTAPGDHPLTGDQVHAHFMDLPGDGAPLRHALGQRHEQYRLDLFERMG